VFLTQTISKTLYGGVLTKVFKNLRPNSKCNILAKETIMQITNNAVAAVAKAYLKNLF
jgi:hypothetical protein